MEAPEPTFVKEPNSYVTERRRKRGEVLFIDKNPSLYLVAAAPMPWIKKQSFAVVWHICTTEDCSLCSPIQKKGCSTAVTSQKTEYLAVSPASTITMTDVGLGNARENGGQVEAFGHQSAVLLQLELVASSGAHSTRLLRPPILFLEAQPPTAWYHNAGPKTDYPTPPKILALKFISAGIQFTNLPTPCRSFSTPVFFLKVLKTCS